MIAANQKWLPFAQTFELEKGYKFAGAGAENISSS